MELMFRLRGLSFIDLAMLRKSDIQGDYLVFRRRKTGAEMRIRLTDEIRALLRQYASAPGSSFLLDLLDSNLKGKALYDDYRKARRNFNYALNKVAEMQHLYRKVSSYCARHTWATMAKNCDIPVAIISESLGHASITTTEAYLKASNNTRLDDANEKVCKALFD
jgi:integrase